MVSLDITFSIYSLNRVLAGRRVSMESRGEKIEDGRNNNLRDKEERRLPQLYPENLSAEDTDKDFYSAAKRLGNLQSLSRLMVTFFDEMKFIFSDIESLQRRHDRKTVKFASNFRVEQFFLSANN